MSSEVGSEVDGETGVREMPPTAEVSPYVLKGLKDDRQPYVHEVRLVVKSTGRVLAWFPFAGDQPRPCRRVA